MQRDEKSETVIYLKERLTERYGVLLSQTQLADLLDRTPGGLRYSLCHPPDFQARKLRACGRRIGASSSSTPASRWKTRLIGSSNW